MLRIMGLTVALAAGAAAGATYTDRGVFEGALLPGAYSNAFDDLSEGLSPDLSYAQGGWAYDIMTDFGEGLYNGDGFLSVNVSFDAIIVDFTGQDVHAFGFDVWATDSAFEPVEMCGEVWLQFADGSMSLGEHLFDSDGDPVFFGLTSSQAVDRILIYTYSDYVAVDNLVVGTMIAAVPAPLASGAGAAGLVLLGVRRRR